MIPLSELALFSRLCYVGPVFVQTEPNMCEPILRMIGERLTNKAILSGLFVILSWSLISCSSTPEPPSADPQAVLSGTDEQIFVGDPMEMNYDPNVIMKRAESYFEKQSYHEAIVEYKHFLDLHRSHVLAPYAQYKIALSHYKRFKTIDRDPEPIEESLAAFQKLLSEFPDSRYETEAREKINACHEHLAEHHLLVGEFYYKKESYLAAAHRYETVIDTYPKLDAAGEAMYHLAKTYQNLGAEQWAADSLVNLAQHHPDSEYYDEGMQMLVKMQKENPSLQIAKLNGGPSGLELLNAGYQNGNQSHGSSPLPTTLVRLDSSSGLAPQPNGHSSAVHTITQQALCSLGSWCETSSVSFAPPAYPAPPPTICQVSQWC